MQPKPINDKPYLVDNDPDFLYINKGSKGFDINPGSRNAMRISVRVTNKVKEPLKAIQQSFKRDTEGKRITLTNLAPEKVTVTVIDNANDKSWTGLSSIVIYLPDNDTRVILEKGS